MTNVTTLGEDPNNIPIWLMNNWGEEKLTNLYLTTQPVSGRTRILIHLCLTQLLSRLKMTAITNLLGHSLIVMWKKDNSDGASIIKKIPDCRTVPSIN